MPLNQRADSCWSTCLATHLTVVNDRRAPTIQWQVGETVTLMSDGMHDDGRWCPNDTPAARLDATCESSCPCMIRSRCFMKRSRSTCSSPSSDSVVELTEEEVARLRSRQSRSRRERRLEIALRQGDLDRAQQVLRDQERERRRRQVQADADLARSIQARADEEFARSLQARRSPPHAAQPRFHQHHFASALLARSSLRGAAAHEGLAQAALLNGRDIDQLDYDELWELSERIGDVRRRGADKREIERLPTRTFDNQASSAEEQSCSICLEAFAQGERVRTLLCLHVFHVVCVDNWLTMNKICPVCRIPIDKR